MDLPAQSNLSPVPVGGALRMEGGIQNPPQTLTARAFERLAQSDQKRCEPNKHNVIVPCLLYNVKYFPHPSAENSNLPNSAFHLKIDVDGSAIPKVVRVVVAVLCQTANFDAPQSPVGFGSDAHVSW